ncbi:unnamed protein product, partial [Choristocarpus tenellus]
DTCGFCRQAIKQDSKHCGLFYTVSALEEEGGKIHKECWQAYQEKTAVKCLHCQGPIAHLPGSFSGRFFTSDEPTGQVHSECWETFCAAKPSKPKELCSHCTEPIAAVENKFSGRYFELDGGIKLHFECRAVYYGANTPKCLHCSAAVTPLEGKFSGEFYEVQGEQGDGRVHCECYEAWMAASAPECLVCGEAVMKQGRFCGEYCAFDDGKTHKISQQGKGDSSFGHLFVEGCVVYHRWGIPTSRIPDTCSVRQPHHPHPLGHRTRSMHSPCAIWPSYPWIEHTDSRNSEILRNGHCHPPGHPSCTPSRLRHDATTPFFVRVFES